MNGAKLSIPPCEPGPDDLVIQVPSIRQDNLGNLPSVAVHITDTDGDGLVECQIARELLGPSAEGLLCFKSTPSVVVEYS